MPRQADILRICVPQALLGTSLRGESRQHPWRIQGTASSTQLAVEVESGADEGEVGEGLRKVAQRLA